jgi:hypothetical protein
MLAMMGGGAVPSGNLLPGTYDWCAQSCQH